MRDFLIALGGGLIGMAVGMIIGAYGDWINRKKGGEE